MSQQGVTAHAPGPSPEASPTLPLPPPKGLGLEDFFEAATRGVLRALEARGQTELNPQPLPPGGGAEALASRPPIIIGIVIDRRLEA